MAPAATHMKYVLLGVLLLCAACATRPDEGIAVAHVDFKELPGWNHDNQTEALDAFARSCAVLAKKPDDAALDAGASARTAAREWKSVCAEVSTVPRQPAAARRFFEQHFVAHSVAGDKGTGGLFTGYYEAELNGSLRRTKRFRIPLFERPDDLITVDLGLFRSELKGQRIVGKLEKTSLAPYDERAAIAGNSLERRARVLVWVDDPIAAFFLEIQGSGRVRLPDGRIMRIGYDTGNGHRYVAIGRPLAEEGAISRPVTMQKIRAWLALHPERRQEVMNLNPSYIFFRMQRDGLDGPIGAQGIALTAQRSLAVDPAFVPLGVPLWLDTSDGEGRPIRRLVIAQDTGGAIKGAVRGDFFWGAGPEAEARAGTMQSGGRYFLLLPKRDSIE